MNKKELIEQLAAESGQSKTACETVLNAFTKTVQAEMKRGGAIILTGFGTFKTTKRAAREGRNPQTGAPLKIKASKSVSFKAGKTLKDAVNA